ncbi:MAG: hypothetical protein HDR11_07650 [Lachnospiraceae bacterium]|nr:hypothetical protein [Lachnospiraceae bacterium]
MLKLTDMQNTIKLSGQWELCWNDTGKGTFETAEKQLDSEGIPCPVPGDVHMALIAAGVIKEPLEDLNSKDCTWMEGKEFWYRKKFTVEEDFLQTYTELVLEGLDLTADIRLNGKDIGRHNNAFIEKVIDISETIKAGENELVVRIDDGVYAVRDKDIEMMKHSWNNEQLYRSWMRKPQFVYGWDWTIWLPSCGIWRDVYINSYCCAKIEDIYITNEFRGKDICKAESVTLSVKTDVKFLKAGKYTVACTVSGDERYGAKNALTENAAVEVSEEKNVVSVIKFEIEEPELWWPNGSGKPYLYNVTVTVKDNAGNAAHTESIRHGIRTVGIVEEQLDEDNSGFTFVINGRKIFAKGANHVPADCFPGRITPEKDRAILEMAAEANMNMVRIWGGGIYGTDNFMCACDELGIMVWHDFMFACAYYPDNAPEFCEEIHTEVTAAIKRLRKYSSLVGWSGNNEIQEMYRSARYWGNDIPWIGGKIYDEILPTHVKELCPDRIYRPSSPYGKKPDEPADFETGDQHIWHFTHRPNWEHYLDLWRFTDFDYKFLSEFGIIGAMNLESLKKCIKPEALNTHSDEWKHHTNSNSDYKLMDFFAEKYFGTAEAKDLQTYILRSQVIQAEIMRHVYDELRSRKFRCSGILLWTLSDSFGINNWSVIDYYLGKRPIYYYLKRSLAPINVSFMGYEVQNFDGMKEYRKYFKGEPKPIELMIANDTLEDRNVALAYRVITFKGEVLKQGKKDVTVPANSAGKFLDVEIADIKDKLVPEETILHAIVCEGGKLVSENRFFFAPYNKLALEPANVKCEVKSVSENTAELTLEADTFVWMLHISDIDGISFSDNDFDLLIGEKRTITVTGKDADKIRPSLLSLNPSVDER